MCSSRDPTTRYKKPRRPWRPKGAKIPTLSEEELRDLSDVLFADQKARDDLKFDPDFWKWVDAADSDPRELLMQAIGEGD